MKLITKLLTLALAFTALSANAATGDLVCTREIGRSETTLVISNGHYTLVDKWHGSFPTISESTGKVAGWQTNADGQLNAEFTFIAFDVPAKFTVIESVGELAIADDAPMANFNCTVE